VPERTERETIRLTLSEQAQRYVQRDAPREARVMAARGALPLPPIELATVLFALMHDPDAEVKDTARASLESLPPNVMKVVVAGATHPAVLSHLARSHREDEAHCEALALNAATSDATIAFLATLPFKRVVDIVANNQERMMRAPEIVESLGSNPLAGRSVIERILRFLGMDAEDADAPEGEISESQTEAALKAVLGADLASFARQLANEDEEFSPDDQSNLYALIQQMSIFQKVKLARLGNKEARGLLIRDRNKVVSVAAITSPKISDTEVVAYAQSRNVCDEVLRIISSNRTWTRNYKVKLSLATNPRTPQPTAMKFVNFLHDNDLRGLVRSKDVPSQVSTHARRILMKKGKM
jgi:hypothetical protein